MTFYHVDIVHLTHICPAEAKPHVWSTQRTLVATIDAGACRQPQPLYIAGQMTALPCARIMPTVSQCPACRPTIIERTVTTIHTGQVTPETVNP